MDAPDEGQAFHADGTRGVPRCVQSYIKMPSLHSQQLPTDYCSHMPLPIPPDYAKNLIRRWEMEKKGISPPTLKVPFKYYYPLPVHHPLVPPRPEIQTCSSSLPCTEPELSGDDQTESESLGAPVGKQEVEKLEISLVAQPEEF